MTEAWIIDGVRSPRGRGKAGVGSLSEVHPQRVMAQVLNGLQEKVGFDTGRGTSVLVEDRNIPWIHQEPC